MARFNKIGDLWDTLESLKALQKDEVKSAAQLRYPDIGTLEVSNGRIKVHVLREDAEKGLAYRLGIPIRYFEKMKTELPDLAIENVNKWLKKFANKRFLIRYEMDEVRAVLTEGYRIVNHLDLVKLIGKRTMEKFAKAECFAHLDDRYLTINLLFMDDMIDNDWVPGVQIMNSETGHGALKIHPRMLRLVCNNGLIYSGEEIQGLYRRVHYGKADNESLWQEIETVFDRAVNSCESIVKKVEGLRDIEVDVEAEINRIGKEYRLTEEQKVRILKCFGEEPERNKFGVIQALTRAAQEEEDFYKQQYLEKVAGKLII
ncbi:MAG: hypothetical protein DRP74_00425 [Candidatus Omnitrophota bacterium]|nr:MAG: hypothetical protein DRP74_00425 [Candidatus Omnitrophota bacterium]